MAANEGVDQVIPGQVLNVPGRREDVRTPARRTGVMAASEREEARRTPQGGSSFLDAMEVPYGAPIREWMRQAEIRQRQFDAVVARGQAEPRPAPFEFGGFQEVNTFMPTPGFGRIPLSVQIPTIRRNPATMIGAAPTPLERLGGMFSPEEEVQGQQPQQQQVGSGYDVQSAQTLEGVVGPLPQGEQTGIGRMKPPWHPDVEQRLLEEEQQGIPYYNTETGRRVPTISGRTQNVTRMLDNGVMPTLILGSAQIELGLTDEELIAAGYEQDQYGNWLQTPMALPEGDAVAGTGIAPGGYGGYGGGGGGGGGGGFVSRGRPSGTRRSEQTGRGVGQRRTGADMAQYFGLTHWRGI